MKPSKSTPEKSSIVLDLLMVMGPLAIIGTVVTMLLLY